MSKKIIISIIGVLVCLSCSFIVSNKQYHIGKNSYQSHQIHKLEHEVDKLNNDNKTLLTDRQSLTKKIQENEIVRRNLESNIEKLHYDNISLLNDNKNLTIELDNKNITNAGSHSKKIEVKEVKKHSNVEQKLKENNIVHNPKSVEGNKAVSISKKDDNVKNNEKIIDNNQVSSIEQSFITIIVIFLPFFGVLLFYILR